MTEPLPPSSRRFNEKEVAQIIKRASEMQVDDATPASTTTGMSLAELEQVAREAGLDPALVRRAATDLDTRVTERKPSLFVGAPTSLQLERTIDGEIPVEEYESLVLEIQRILGEMGTASTLGRTLQWTMSPQSGRHHSGRTVQVVITPRHGHTTIRIDEPLGGLAGGLFGGLMGGMGGGLSGVAVGIGVGAFHSGTVAVGLMGVFVSSSYLLARTIFGQVSRRRGARLQELMSRLADHVAATASSAPAIAPNAPDARRPAEDRALERGG